MQAAAEGMHRGVLHKLLHVLNLLHGACQVAVGHEGRYGVSRTEPVLFLLKSISNNAKRINTRQDMK